MEERLVSLFRISTLCITVLAFITFPWWKKPRTQYTGPHVFGWLFLWLAMLNFICRHKESLFLTVLVVCIGVFLLYKNYRGGLPCNKEEIVKVKIGKQERNQLIMGLAFIIPICFLVLFFLGGWLKPMQMPIGFKVVILIVSIILTESLCVLLPARIRSKDHKGKIDQQSRWFLRCF